MMQLFFIVAHSMNYEHKVITNFFSFFFFFFFQFPFCNTQITKIRIPPQINKYRSNSSVTNILMINTSTCNILYYSMKRISYKSNNGVFGIFYDLVTCNVS